MGMKKTPSKEVLSKEASFWIGLKMAVKENPTKGCHK
jgi:hypothetical protein